MEQIIRDIENEEFKSDKLKLNAWTSERLKIQQSKELKDKIYDIFIDYLDDKETAMYNFSELEIVRKFYQYLDKRI